MDLSLFEINLRTKQYAIYIFSLDKWFIWESKMNVSNFFLRNFEEDDIFILSVIKFVHLYIKKKKKKKKKK
jgi:hypothetical protein